MTLDDVLNARWAWERAQGHCAQRVYIHPVDALAIIHEPLSHTDAILPAGAWVPYVGGLEWYEDATVPTGTCRFEVEP